MAPGSSRLRTHSTAEAIGPGSGRDRANTESGRIAQGGIRRFALLTANQRNATLDAEDDLVAVAQDAYRAGWRVHERDVLGAAARDDLHVWIWPALATRIAREAKQTTARG